MFSELPKLLDRNFAIGFVLPAAFIAGGLWLVLGAHNLVGPPTLAAIDEVGKAVLAIIGIWLSAILLLALNRPFLRLLEGYPLRGLIHLYGRRHPLAQAWLENRVRRRFERYQPTIELQAAIDAARAESRPEPAMPEGHPYRLRFVAECLPPAADYVLPTRFGNLFRAFETYSNVLYGLDAIPAWPRLQAVMPEHFRTMLADAKAQLDFCANLAVGGAAVTLVYLGLVLARWQLPEPWLALGSIALAMLGYELALSAAAQFGSYVKSAFDLYRADLAKTLGLELPRSVEAERVMWRTVSRMMIYRSATRAAELTQYREHRDEKG